MKVKETINKIASIEQKAKAYDKALEKAKDFYKGYKQRDNQLYADDLETIFPELKESEDERIRKGLIEGFQQYDEEECWRDIEYLKIKDVLTWLEKQGEQKPTNKVKPKFKVGDWIVSLEYSNVVKVLEILEDNYRLDFGKDTIGTLCTELVDNNYRLWDVTKDAKNGDMLVLNDEVFIYAHRKQLYSIVVAHCFVDSAGGFYFGGEFRHTEKGNSIHPATKEQRDALIKTMKDAGYTFDFKKKELKRIEQKSAEWSEEDKKVFVNIKACLRNTNKDYSRELDWLKSLRPQKQWKPTKEQMDALNDVISSRDIKYDVLSELWKDLEQLKDV